MQWLVAAILSVLGLPVVGVLWLGAVLAGTCSEYEAPETCAQQRRTSEGMSAVLGALVCLVALLGLGGGVVDGRRGRDFMARRVGSVITLGLFNMPFLLAYAVGYGIGRLLSGRRPARRTGAEVIRPDVWAANAPDPLSAVRELAAQPHGVAGGHVGWFDSGHMISARPRGGMLVIGPPGSGKSSAVIIPSVIVAPGACVSSSIKGDVMGSTAQVRALCGRVWHLDPGGDEQPAPGVLACRWSPLVSVRTWDDARRTATRMAEPMMNTGKGDNGSHFVARARDWVECLLFAAHLDRRPISHVADWSVSAGDEAAQVEVMTILQTAAESGDLGARIAGRQLEGLIGTPDRERGSIISTMTGLLRIYGSVVARQIGDEPNFDPHEFVRSSDTLYITASPDRQKEYAPIIASLLEELRFAVYARHRAEDEGREAKRPHVTFVLDEANNTAPIPLPAIISEAGGQSLHIIVGIQDLSRARARWGQEADGFLTLFPTKVVLPGVVEPYTLDALSSAAGEYDRTMVGYSESVSYVGQYSIPVRQQNPTYSVQRQRVLTQGDIAQIPSGSALLWEGAQWALVTIGMHWRHPVWRAVITSAQQRQVTETRALPLAAL